MDIVVNLSKNSKKEISACIYIVKKIKYIYMFHYFVEILKKDEIYLYVPLFCGTIEKR